MTQAQMDTIEQGNLLKTQPSPEKRPGNNNQLLRSLQSLLQIEGEHPATVDKLFMSIVGFTGELVQKLKKLIMQQVLDLIRIKQEIMLPELVQDLASKPTPKTQLTAIITILNQFQQEGLNPFEIPTFLQQTPSTIDIWIITTSILLPILWTTNAIPDLVNQVSGYSTIESFFAMANLSLTSTNELLLSMNVNARNQQNLNQSIQQVEQAVTHIVEKPRQNEIRFRSVHNLLIAPISAYPLQQTSRMPLLFYTTEIDQQQRQSQRSISPTNMRAEESEEDDFQDEMIPRIIMPHLQAHKNDIETAQ
ncbi:MAG: hypothetical protein EZS28_011210 [Streblomastix strix]|uniref:Uncharacterized protein n=1 Tax=Streblomastix strix TaxID=222440 RepID=A0A5J4WE76_9EUKA|nr:MAG: hypothetical protein EZS28_011210 [Streblomastix strix]